MVGDGLRQTDALAHTLAVSSHLAPRDLRHAGPLQGLVGQPCGLLTAKTMEPQGPKNEIITSGPGREGIELRAISNLPEQLHRLTRDRKSTRLNSSHQIISYAVFRLKKKRT